MNDPNDPRDDRENEYGGFDETLADGPLAPPPAAAREWLADQRSMHGLLRAMHQADAQSAELRVQRILDCIDARPREARRWWLVAGAAAALCVSTLLLLLRGHLPEAEATVQRAAELLRQDVDRRFLLTTVGVDAKGNERLRHEFELTARPGMRFFVTGSFSMGPLAVDATFGCDGKMLWFRAGNEQQWRRSAPLAEASRLLAGMGDVLDLGYLDVQALVERLPQSFELRTVGRERGADGRQLLRIDAVGTPRRPDIQLRQASLWCDEDTGMIARIELEAEGKRGRHRFTFESVGVVDVAPDLYQRPW
jgi:hypothetical protein